MNQPFIYVSPLFPNLPPTSLPTAGKTIVLTRGTFVAKVMSLLFNTLSRFAIAFLPRSKHLLIMAAVTICSDSGDQENKVGHCFHCFLINLPWSDGTRCHGLCFSVLSFQPAFSLSSFTFIKRLFRSSLLSVVRVVSSVYLWGYWHISWKSWFKIII